MSKEKNTGLMLLGAEFPATPTVTKVGLSSLGSFVGLVGGAILWPAHRIWGAILGTVAGRVYVGGAMWLTEKAEKLAEQQKTTVVGAIQRRKLNGRDGAQAVVNALLTKTELGDLDNPDAAAVVMEVYAHFNQIAQQVAQQVPVTVSPYAGAWRAVNALRSIPLDYADGDSTQVQAEQYTRSLLIAVASQAANQFPRPMVPTYRRQSK